MMIDSQTLAGTVYELAKQNNTKGVNAFFTFLKEKNLESLLPQIKRHIEHMKREHMTHDTLVIRTRYEMKKDVVTQIAKALGAPSDVQTSMINDPSIIGSFEASYQGNIYDDSVESKLSQLTTTMKV